MSLYGRLFARLYDHMLASTERAGLSDRRHRLLADATGKVLEVGAGTGLNLDHYPPSVEQLVLAEPEEPMARMLQRRLASDGRRAQVVTAPAESLPLDDDSVDTVVSTLVLCTVDDPGKALSEIERVLRPGGQLLFLEHVRADDPRVARWQDRLHGLWYRVGHGCHCNRPTPALIEASPLEITSLERSELAKAPPITRPLATGRAIAR